MGVIEAFARMTLNNHRSDQRYDFDIEETLRPIRLGRLDSVEIDDGAFSAEIPTGQGQDKTWMWGPVRLFHEAKKDVLQTNNENKNLEAQCAAEAISIMLEMTDPQEEDKNHDEMARKARKGEANKTTEEIEEERQQLMQEEEEKRKQREGRRRPFPK